MSNTRFEDAERDLAMAHFLVLDAMHRAGKLTRYSGEHCMTGGDGKGDGITPTQI